MGKTLALFDFDGTITRYDSLIVFLRQMVGISGALKGTPETLLRWMALLLQGRLSHDSAKEALLKTHLRRKSRQEWEHEVAIFCSRLAPEYYNPEILRRLRELQLSGAVVSIVSASIDIWLQPFADKLNAELICTQSAWRTDRWTGFASPNCRKEEKVRRVQATYDLTTFDRIVAYGNTAADHAMLKMADEAWWVRKDGEISEFGLMD
ncbi:MAG: HAD family hydrolase [Saprospiraceae bacterium]